MDNSILTCYYVNKILENDENLMSLIPMENINALHDQTPDLDDKVHYPYISYSRSSLIPLYSKENIPVSSNVQITYNVVSDVYITSARIANALRNALEMKGYRDDDIYIDRIRLITANESTYNNAFIQTLVFETSVC